MRRIWLTLAGIVLLVTVGSIVFSIVEQRDLLTSAYFTIITLTTVGYGDVTPTTPEGRIVAVVMISSGGVLFALFLAFLTQMIVELQVARILGRRKLEKDIAALNDHFIVCGLGRIGAIVCREFDQNGVPFVVIEQDADAIRKANEEGYLHLLGDATDDDDLKRAGIMRARGLVAVLPTDADNVYVTMSARDLNRGLQIVARGQDERTARKLARAGASRVISPYEIGGLRMAHAILRPNVIDFIEAATRAGTEINMEEIPVEEDSQFAGMTLKESGIRQKFGLIIVAIRRPDGRMAFNPSHETRIEPRDVLITMGPQQQQKELETCCGVRKR